MIYKFWYDYVKLKFDKIAKLCFIDTDSFIVFIKTDDNYKDIAEDIETRFGTSNYELNRPLPNGKNKKSIGVMKDELGRKTIKELRTKTYSYITDDGSEDRKAKVIKSCHKKKKNLKIIKTA